MKKNTSNIAYFSMEFAFHSDMPNYAGGLGVLAADIIYSSADLDMPVVGISLFYHQQDDPKRAFPFAPYLQDTGKKVSVQIEDRHVAVAIWQMNITGTHGHIVPVFFLSTYLPENEKWDRDLTKYLYASDEYTRISQELILGVGGVRALEALGYSTIEHYHMNEGHSAFLTLELLNRYNGDIDKVKHLCTFTTHTPVAAGFDRFSMPMIQQVLADTLTKDLSPYISDERLDMARMGIGLSGIANSVSQKHQEVCHELFPEYRFINVTNGIYHPHWVSQTMKDLYDTYLPGWEQEPELLAHAPQKLPREELGISRHTEKTDLCSWINDHAEFFAFDDITDEDCFDPHILTLSFARRYVPYKRHELILQDIEKLIAIGEGQVQLIFAGRCHPDDSFCNNIRHTIFEKARELRGRIKIVVVSDYNLSIARRLVSGSDIWLNTPVPPREASGTSGMKAALNGVLNLSVADGWWIEGFDMSPHSGWTFPGTEAQHNDYLNQHDAYELLLQLEDAIDCYYNHPDEWHKRMTHAIALLATFNTHRVVREYQEKMWS